MRVGWWREKNDWQEAGKFDVKFKINLNLPKCVCVTRVVPGEGEN